MNSRRDFLKTSMLGAGAFAFSPYLLGDSAPKKSSGFPKRFVFIRKSNGTSPHEYILPTFSAAEKSKNENREPFEVSLDKHELPDWMQDLNEHKENMTILQGLSSQMCEGGHNSYQSIMAALNTKGDTLGALKWASIDYELDKLFPSPVGHVELSFAYDRTGVNKGFCIPAPYARNFCYSDPITAYKNLFSAVLNPSLVEADNRMLSYLGEGQKSTIQSLENELKKGHQNYLNSITSIQKRNQDLMKLTEKIKSNMPDSEMIFTMGKPTATLAERHEAMTEVLVSALITGMTNCVTYTIDNLNTGYSGLQELGPGRVGLHHVGHNGAVNDIPSEGVRKIINRHHLKQVKTIVERLKAQPEGNGTMFDNTMIMYFPEGGERHHGPMREPPFLIMSGKNCNLDIAGRYIRLPFHGTEGHKTLGNWYTTLLNVHGNDIAHYGDFDSTMSAKKLAQKGPIKQFMKA